MKRNFLTLFAVVLALIASSFTTKKFINVYLVYIAGAQTEVINYNQQLAYPGLYVGQARLAWFKASDNNGNVTQSEFTTAFNALDLNHNGSLDDQIEQDNVLEKKGF